MSNPVQGNLLRIVYKLYILFIPFSTFTFISQDNVINRYFFFSISCFLLYFGFLIILFKGKGLLKINSLIKEIFKLYCYMSIFSIIAALILYFPLGEKYGETTLNAIWGDIIFYFVVLLNIYFNYYCLSYVINIKELKKVFYIDVFILLILGYVQYFTINGVTIFSKIYAWLQKIFNLYDLPNAREKGITFFGSELSSASILFLFIIPFLFSVIFDKKELPRNKFINIVILALFVPLFLTTTSSSVYIGLILTLITAIAINVNIKLYKLIIIFGGVIGLGTVIIYGTDIINIISNQFEYNSLGYIIIGKVFDTSNLSTAMRFSAMGMHIWIFKHFLFTGTGNGIQGYFYESNLQDWAYKSNEVQSILSGEIGLPNGGGAFFTAYLTGYGLLGVYFLIKFIKKFIYQLQKKSEQLGYLYYVFLIGIALFNFQAWTVMGIKQNLSVCFLLSIPFIENRIKNT